MFFSRFLWKYSGEYNQLETGWNCINTRSIISQYLQKHWVTLCGKRRDSLVRVMAWHRLTKLQDNIFFCPHFDIFWLMLSSCRWGTDCYWAYFKIKVFRYNQFNSVTLTKTTFIWVQHRPWYMNRVLKVYFACYLLCYSINTSKLGYNWIRFSFNPKTISGMPINN